MKIGIVNERPDEAGVLRQAVALKPEHRVIWTAYTGAQAVALCGTDPPDLVMMDVSMSGMDGVETTRRIMATAPCAILIVTGSVRGDAGRVFEAMGHGAVDAVDMPAAGGGPLRDRAAPLLTRLTTISQLITAKEAVPHESASRDTTFPAPGTHPLVAIGASAGGPAALAVVLRGLPRDFPASVVIIQHVEAQFAPGMAEWLSRQSAMPVTIACEGDRIAVGAVLLAGTSDHLVLRAANRLGYTREPRDHHYRPSVDVFFESVSRLWRGPAVGVLLTGMGSDGARGLKALRDRGHHTIAQDQASSAVHGMPKAAAGLAAAVDILPMARIASKLVDVIAARA
jgi:chemotaxis response regulator CheB